MLLVNCLGDKRIVSGKETLIKYTIFFWEELPLKYRLNCSFSLLTFSKLRFWPLRKKQQNSPLSFATVAVLAPKADIDSVYADVAP